MKYLSMFLMVFWHSIYAGEYPIKVGDTTVIIHELNKGQGKTFVHLHQNETTALKAAKYVIAREGGTILTLAHPGGARNITFHLHKKKYEFDPNRIFTNAGIKKTLTQFGAYTPQAHHEVKKLAEKIKKMIPPGKVIAIHNNNKSYSLGEYLPGYSLSSQAQKVHVKDTCRCRNFYLVTQLKDYIRLKKSHFNEVLQTKNPEDDGSLSVFLAKRDYINVEAGYNQLAAQVKMLQYA